MTFEIQQKYVAVLYATSGERRRAEQQYARQMISALYPLYQELSQILVRDRLLPLFAREALLLKRSPLFNRVDLIRASRESTSILFQYERELRAGPELNQARNIMRRWNREAYEWGAVIGGRELGFSIKARNSSRLFTSKAEEFIFELTDQEIIEWLQNRVVRFGRGITASVIEDARRMIRDQLYLGDVGVDELASNIASTSAIPEWRGLKIARTEIQESFQTARFEQHRRSGVQRHTWFTVGDRRVRPEHNDNDGVEVIVGKEFPSGQLHPGDNTGGLAINCRCSTIPDLSEPILLQPWEGRGDLKLRQDRGLMFA